MPLYTVNSDIVSGCVTIHRDGWNVLYWDCLEWEEDPDVVFAMVEAIKLALTDPIAMDEKLKNMGILETGEYLNNESKLKITPLEENRKHITKEIIKRAKKQVEEYRKNKT